jgi:hypothetical protein
MRNTSFGKMRLRDWLLVIVGGSVGVFFIYVVVSYYLGLGIDLVERLGR